MTCPCHHGFLRRPHRRDDAYTAEPCRECHPLPAREIGPEVIAQMAMVEAMLRARGERRVG